MDSDLGDNLQETLGSGYTVERELGGGGMSRVFLARDGTLGRNIVIKVLPAATADIPIERFKREIAVAARLQHPHIVPLLSAGELHNLPYYTMPYVEGESLRARLARGERMSIAECVSILKDVARALAYAHEHGVVHRDIKPENVLITGGSAVVTDFGIAKAIATARTEGGGASAKAPPGGTLTEAGMALGTPAYMAPEQISGDGQADHRMDVYAFGCVAYEMLNGAAPFAGRSAHRLITAHLTDTPEPIAARRTDCPRQLADLVMRCLAKEPAQRPQSAAEILRTLDGVAVTGSRRSWQLPAQMRGRRGVAAAAALVLAAAVAGYLGARAWAEPGTSEARIAVIPFANVGGDSAQQYFVDGVSDELTTALGRMTGLKVAARQLAYRYRGQRDLDPRSVGEALDVAYIVQGSVRRAGGRLRLSAQLTSTQDGAELWADEVERDSTAIFSAQDDITRAIAARLVPKATIRATRAPATGSTQGTSSPEAYDLYLRGRFLLERRGDGVRLSLDNFERAIARDSMFGRAHAGLAFALELIPYYGGVPARDVRARAWDAAQRALRIDSTLAEAHAALGMLYMHEYNWSRAIGELRSAVDYDPDDAGVRLQYGRVLLYVGDLLAAKEQFMRARQSDPYSATLSAWVALVYAYYGRMDSAKAELRRALQIDSTNFVALGNGAWFLATAGENEAAHALASKLPNESAFMEYRGYVLARTGSRASALRVMRELERGSPRQWFGDQTIALIALALGDTAHALAALERATDAREIWPSSQPLFDPAYDAVRGSQRFAALLRRVGLDDRGFTQPNGGRPR